MPHAAAHQIDLCPPLGDVELTRLVKMRKKSCCFRPREIDKLERLLRLGAKPAPGCVPKFVRLVNDLLDNYGFLIEIDARYRGKLFAQSRGPKKWEVRFSVSGAGAMIGYGTKSVRLVRRHEADEPLP